MTKITVDKALIEQALEAIELNWKTNEGDAVKPLLRTALAEQAVEPDSSIKVWVLVDKDGNPQKWRTPCFVGPESDTQLECFNREQPDRAPHKSVMLAAPPPPAEPAVEPDRYAWYQYMDHGNGMGWIEHMTAYDPRTPEYAELHHRVDWADPKQVRNFRALYASPPPAAEVPLLTDEEMMEMVTANAGYGGTNFDRVARAIEQAVRQKAGL